MLRQEPIEGGYIRFREPGETVTNMIYNSIRETNPQSYGVLLLGGVPLLGIIRYEYDNRADAVDRFLIHNSIQGFSTILQYLVMYTTSCTAGKYTSCVPCTLNMFAQHGQCSLYLSLWGMPPPHGVDI